MADYSDCSDYLPVEHASVEWNGNGNGKFCIHVDDSELEADAFMKSPKCKKNLIYSKKNRCLILNNADRKFQFVSDGRCQAEIKSPFDIQMYKDTMRGDRGVAVILSVKEHSQNYIVSCSDDGEVEPCREPAPDMIGGSKHRAVFYLKQFSSTEHRLESSVRPNHFLGLQSLSDPCPFLVLVRDEDEVDERTTLQLR